jgi:hypothetical protein
VVLAPPLGPAGSIRGNVMPNHDVALLATELDGVTATPRMAISVA